MRVYLYLLAGITSSLIGWNLSQFLLEGFPPIRGMPEIIVFPCVAIALAIGMVINEIFISNPTRPKRCFSIAKKCLPIALGLGAGLGLLAGLLFGIVALPENPIPESILRPLGWLIIGAAVGLAEGWTWRWRSLEAGDPKRFRQRFRISVIGAIASSLAAAVLFETLRAFLPNLLQALPYLEDPLGFSILGLLLGLTFSITSSPSYLAALRAGGGFEFREGKNARKIPATIDTDLLKFVSEDRNEEEIEEGLSVQLPPRGSVIVGSDQNPKAHIRLPNAPMHLANIELQGREVILKPDPKFFRHIAINGERLGSKRTISLKHNNVLTFYAESAPEEDTPDEREMPNEEQLYRFVYYNRFLDPEA